MEGAKAQNTYLNIIVPGMSLLIDQKDTYVAESLSLYANNNFYNFWYDSSQFPCMFAMAFCFASISCSTIFRAETFPSSGFGDLLFCKCDLQVYIYEILEQKNLNPSFYHLCSPQLMDKCEDHCILRWLIVRWVSIVRMLELSIHMTHSCTSHTISTGWTTQLYNAYCCP